jgi:hypothetical protein
MKFRNTWLRRMIKTEDGRRNSRNSRNIVLNKNTHYKIFHYINKFVFFTLLKNLKLFYILAYFYSRL